MQHTHITLDEHGEPIVKGTSIRVADILIELGSGVRVTDIVEANPQLSVETVYAAIVFAADHAVNRA